jgi:hypothetical protein
MINKLISNKNSGSQDNPGEQFTSSTKNPHGEESNTNFPGLNHKFGSSQATPDHLGEQTPKSNRHMWDRRWRRWIALLWIWNGSLKWRLKFSLKSFEMWIGAYERVVEFKMWLLECYVTVWSGQPSYGGGGTLFIVETQIIAVVVKIPKLVR